MHPCHFCRTPFELDLGTIPLGYFARGRCPSCGSVNVIVPGMAPPAVAAARPGAPVVIEPDSMDVEVMDASGSTELPEAQAADAPTGQVVLQADAEDIDFVDESPGDAGGGGDGTDGDQSRA